MLQTFKIMDYWKIVRKLIGRIEPIGETNEDARRLNNLKEMCSLVENLITDIDDMAYQNRDAYQFSVKQSAEYATDFLNRIRSV